MSVARAEHGAWLDLYRIQNRFMGGLRSGARSDPHVA